MTPSFEYRICYKCFMYVNESINLNLVQSTFYRANNFQVPTARANKLLINEEKKKIENKTVNPSPPPPGIFIFCGALYFT